jgi:SPP1 gp7 family putative phage head morphogenesis protein
LAIEALLRVEKGFDGIMIGFEVPGNEALILEGVLGAIPEGSVRIPAKDMHITLALVRNLEIDAVIKPVRVVAEKFRGTLDGKTGGLIRFNPDNEGMVPVCAHFDSPWISSFRETIMDEFRRNGIDPLMEHGFTPHITLAYLPAGSSLPDIEIPNLSIQFDGVTVFGTEEEKFFIKFGSDDQDGRGGKIWKSFDRVARKWEGQFKRTAARLFEEEEREIEGRINGLKGKSIKTIDYEAILTAIATYLAVEAVKKWQTAFLPLMMGLMQEQLSAWTGAVGIDWDIENPAVADFIRGHSFAFAQRISDTTMEEVKRLVLAAQGEGWSIVRMVDELKAVYGGWSDLRAEMIARSETIRSSNAGLVEGYKQNGISEIEWFAALDDRLCPFCGEMHGKRLAIGEAWFEGGSEMYVGQERLVMDYGDVFWPPLHPNCRCVMQPVLGDG